MSTPPVLFLAGGVLLVLGAELLVRGASRLAAAAGVSSLVVGLTVVAFGTSAPEMAVTVGSAWGGQADVALGNVVGSNIFNVLFILGVSALIAPLAVDRRLIRTDVPLMIGVSILALGLALDDRVGRLDGVLLFAGIVVYTVTMMRRSRLEVPPPAAEPEGPARDAARTDGPTRVPSGGVTPTPGPWPLDVVLVILGLALLVVGSRWFVDAAVQTAQALDVSELVIGLTIVAAGTSLPEVATSVLASIRGERDIAVGNVVGSNIFNLLAVLGLGGIVAPGGVPVSPGALTFDLPVMIGVALATLPIFVTGYAIARWEGAVFLAFYGAYTAYLVLDATRHHAVDEFGSAMIWFVIPLTALTLLVLVLRRPRRGGETPTPES